VLLGHLVHLLALAGQRVLELGKAAARGHHDAVLLHGSFQRVLRRARGAAGQVELLAPPPPPPLLLLLPPPPPLLLLLLLLLLVAPVRGERVRGGRACS
jgi:hypothetical protein